MMLRGLVVITTVLTVVVIGQINMANPIVTEKCKGPVCEEAENQAVKLARLKVLSDHINGTMAVVESLVSSLNEEKAKVEQELCAMVGHHCRDLGSSSLTIACDSIVKDTEPETETIIPETTTAPTRVRMFTVTRQRSTTSSPPRLVCRSVNNKPDVDRWCVDNCPGLCFPSKCICENVP